MRRRLASIATAVLTATSLAGATGVAGATTPTRAARHAPQWYLALGDSLAAGYQPGAGDDKTGGYVGDALQVLKKQNSAITLTNLACSGEDTKSFTSGTVCAGGNAADSQQTQALSFLKTHAGKPGVITLDLGANDIQRCVQGTNIDYGCVAGGLLDVARNLPSILHKLHAAAPNSKIVVLNYYNPFLAAYLLGSKGQQIAGLSKLLAATFNLEIGLSAASVRAQVADVSGAFQSNADRPVVKTPYGELPTNVARICSWTWMCGKQNIHPNDQGYDVMAEALAPHLQR